MSQVRGARLEVGAMVELMVECVPATETLVGWVVEIRPPGPPFGSEFKVRLSPRSYQLLLDHSPLAQKRGAVPEALWCPGDRVRKVC